MTKAAFEALAETPDERDLWDAIDAAMAELRPFEAEAALGWVLSLPPGAKRDELTLGLLGKWAQVDPARAMDFLQNIESLRLQRRASREILESWGATDPAGAITWLNANSANRAPRLVSDQLLAVMEGYAKNDAESAFQYAAILPETTGAQRRLKAEAIEAVVDTLIASERLGDALNLIQTLPEGGVRKEAFGELIEEWAEFDPLTASKHLNLLGEDGVSEAQRSLMRSWAEYDPAGAAEWLATIEVDEGEMGGLVTTLISRWTQYDLDQSAAWLNQIPPSPETDRAVAIFTYRSAQDDPAGAMSWAESITREGMRDRLMSRVAGEWMEQDMDSFNSYLESAELSDAQRQRLIEAGGSGRGWGRGR